MRQGYNPLSVLDRTLGSFRGLAVGDALGAPVEFSAKGTFAQVTSFQPTFHFDLAPGVWTDDTAQSLCLADALVENNGYDSYKVMKEYLAWCEEGKNTPNNKCFDIGIQTSAALQQFKTSPMIPTTKARSSSAGNGCVMRLAPVAIVGLQGSLNEARRLFEVTARETHYCKEAEEATAIFGNILLNLYCGDNPKHALESLRGIKDTFGLIEGLYYGESPGRLNGGYVRDTILSVYPIFRETYSFQECVLEVVNNGNDADTAGAVAGQLAGARYGDSSIPEEWREELWQSERFYKLHKRLFATSPVILKTRFQEDFEYAPFDIC